MSAKELVIFIAKDNDEYGRYKDALNRSDIDPAFIQKVWREKCLSGSSSLSNNVDVNIQGNATGTSRKRKLKRKDSSGIPRSTTKTPEGSECGRRIELDDFTLIMLNGDKDSLPWKDRLKNNINNEAELQQVASGFLEGLKNAINGADVQCKCVKYLFVHLGDGGDPKNVTRIEKIVQEKLKSANHILHIDSIQLLSSMRDDSFCLNPITLPRSLKCVKEIAEALYDCVEYYNSDIGVREATSRFLYSQYQLVDFLLNESGSVNVDAKIGCEGAVQEVKFVLVATSEKRPIYAIKGVLGNILKAYGATICEYGKMPQDESERKNFRVVPIFINDKKHRGIGSVPAIGACPPPEFVLDCEKEGDRKWDIDKVWETLRDRIKVWSKDGTLRGVSINELRDWMAGAFRKYCFLDERAHGMSGDMNLSEAQERTDEFISKWLSRAGEDAQAFRAHFQRRSAKEPDWVSLMRVLFQSSFDKFADVIGKCDSGDNTLQDEVKKVFCLDENGGAIVSPCGLATRFSTPSTTVRVLLIDDSSSEECKEDKDGGRLTSKNFPGFEFTPLMKDCGMFSRERLFTSFDDAIKEQIKGKRSFDAVLLDLCLDSDRRDPSGYQLISRIRGQMPNVPIIVYSQFDDMGHEKRAFDEGAAWFLKKSEYKKLARHLDSLFRNPEWKTEWDAVSDIAGFGVGDFTFEDAKDDFLINRINSFSAYAYLIYRALRTLPGKKICLKRIGTGYGGAMTVKAWKGNKISSPTIVKIASRFNTVTEYERYFRFIRPFLANECGRIEDPAISIDNEHSVVVYTYAGRSDGKRGLTSLKDMLLADMESPDNCSDDKYAVILKRILDDMLSRIHNVGEGDSGVFGELSSFPNPAFDEVQVDADFTHISDNYVCRIPLERRASADCKFVSQRDGGEAAKSYMFHGGWKSNGKSPARIELYDESKRVIALSDEYVEHVLEFRNHLIPGSYVWVDGKIADNVTVNDALLNQLLMDMPVEDFVDAQQGKIGGINGDISERKNSFGKLIESLMGGNCDKDFRSLSQEPYKAVVDNLKAGNWEFYKQITALLMPGGDVFVKVKDSLVCPCGIVHGDMNLGNIMVDGEASNFSGIWFIDFARTRRDYIAHDFNVLFTSILSLLFCKELWLEKSYGANESHSEIMEQRFADLVRAVVFRQNDGAPKLVPADSRVRMIYSMLRQIRTSALKDHKISIAAYAYTTALMCLVTSRVMLQHERNLPAAAGMIVAAAVCCDELLKGVEK